MKRSDLSIRVTLAAAAIAAAATLPGCASAKTAGKDAETPQQAVQEYLAEESGLRLAEGWRWPPTVAFPTAGPDGKTMYYQRGYGTTRADRFWYCSWESAYTSSTAGSPIRTEAQAQLGKVRETHMYKYDVISVDRPRFNQTLDSALSGNVEMMKQDVTLNCENLTE